MVKEKIKESDKVINNWLRINNAMSSIGLANLLLSITNISLVVFTVVLYSRAPIVVLTDKNDSRYYISSKNDTEIKKGTIQRHIKKYVNHRYKWNDFNRTKIAKSVEYLTTKGFNKKVINELVTLRKQFKGKLSQRITEVKVIVSDKSTLAKFDRVLRVSGIPFIIPTEISFRLVKGISHSLNPSGLEIDGITIHEKR